MHRLAQHQEDGYTLATVMVFFVIFTLLGLAVINLGDSEAMAGFRYYHKARAAYNAQAGIHKALWRLNNVAKEATPISDATVVVHFDSVSMVLTAVGTSAGMTDSVRILLDLQTQASNEGQMTLRPNGVGTFAMNNANPAVDNWLNVDETTADDDTSVVYSEPGKTYTDTYLLQDPAVPSNSSVDSIRVYCRARSEGKGHNARTSTAIRTNAALYNGSANTLNNSFQEYSTVYALNPNTGQAWTWDEVTVIEAGITNFHRAYCTQVWVDVYYSDKQSTAYQIAAWEVL